MYTVGGVTIDDVCTMLRHRALARNVKPSLHMDCNFLARKLSTDASDPTDSILKLCQSFISRGIVVFVVMDNRVRRHHSKKATIVRNREAEQARVESVHLKGALMRNICRIRDTSLSTEEINETKTKIEFLETVIKKKENVVKKRDRYTNFFEEIEDEIHPLLSENPDNLFLLNYAHRRIQQSSMKQSKGIAVVRCLLMGTS